MTAFILWPFSPSKKSPLDPPSPWSWLGAYPSIHHHHGAGWALTYFWLKLRGQDLNDYYLLEGSPDNRDFSPLPLRFELIRRGEFDHYVMRNAEPIPARMRYLRIVLKAPVPSQSWANQIANIVVER